MPKLTAAQRAYIKKRSKYHEPGAEELDDELNIVPFLDIVVNLVMFLLMITMSVAFYSQVDASLPTFGGRGPANSEPRESLNLNVTVTAEGVIVAASGGKLAPGCQTTGSGRVITVPRQGNNYDWAGLTRCVERVKSEFEDETKVTISADPLIEYQYLLYTMDALRENGDGDELFPDVQLSAGVR